MANCLTRNRSETPSALKNCKQFFTDEEWNRARESSEALVNQLNLNNIVRYNTLINYMDKPVEITIIGYHPHTIVGIVQHVVNNIDSSFVHLSPAWLEGAKKNNHLVHLEAIEKILRGQKYFFSILIRIFWTNGVMSGNCLLTIQFFVTFLKR